MDRRLKIGCWNLLWNVWVGNMGSPVFCSYEELSRPEYVSPPPSWVNMATPAIRRPLVIDLSWWPLSAKSQQLKVYVKLGIFPRGRKAAFCPIWPLRCENLSLVCPPPKNLPVTDSRKCGTPTLWLLYPWRYLTKFRDVIRNWKFICRTIGRTNIFV